MLRNGDTLNMFHYEVGTAVLRCSGIKNMGDVGMLQKGQSLSLCLESGDNIGWINFDSADLYGYGVLACKVNYIVLGNFVDDWLQSGNGPGNLNDDRDVDFQDYSILASYWLSYCPDDWPLK